MHNKVNKDNFKNKSIAMCICRGRNCDFLEDSDKETSQKIWLLICAIKDEQVGFEKVEKNIQLLAI